MWKGKKHHLRWRARPDGGVWVDNWFSNMGLCSEPITWKDRLFCSIEHAYQAAKYVDPEKITLVQQAARPEQAKWLGRKWSTETPNWETYRVQVMWELCAQKWSLAKHRAELNSHKEPIVEFNNWSDSTWGVVIKPNGEVLGGEDLLGRIITEIRRQLIEQPHAIPQITPEFQLVPAPVLHDSI